ncbi:MAG: DUF1289 domain-containing protein [Alphaproteobacteria bacterium]|nr:DUF1289 domain-containing protein [Alphaproteobacteria bacterium]
MIDIISPCVGVCQLDNHDYCIGCLRHRDEITLWISLDNEKRLVILQELKQRRRALGRTSDADKKPRRRKR